jgi:Ca-activated chloride channel family protein
MARPEELDYRTSPVDLPASRGGGERDGAATARQLLSAAGLAGSGLGGEGRGGGQAPAAIAPPPLDVAAPPVTDTLRALPLDAPPIDFVDLALSDTTELQIPEHLDNDFDYQLTRWNDYFQVEIVARRSLRKLRTMPKDVVLLVDTSSSVPQDWVERVTAGIKHGLHSLNEGDRFNIVLFNEEIRFFSTDGPVDATPANIDAARRWIDDAKAKGYTDVNAALTGLLRRDVERNRVYNLLLISDGRPTRGVIDTRELINRITRDNDLVASIYCIGIGPPRWQNRELLDFLAYRNRGYCLFVDDEEGASAAVLDLLSRIRFPLIKDLTLHVAGVDAGQVYPVDLPNVHQGERFSVYGRFGAAGVFTVQIAGNSAGQPVDFTFTRDLADAPLGDQGIARQWAFWKLHHLYSEIIRRGETQALLEQIRALRRQYGLKTLY